MRILFLYTEIAEYLLAACSALVEQGAEVHIVRFPVNKEAPFKFSDQNNITFYDRFRYNTKELAKLVDSIDPSFIYCSGWIDKTYLKICKRFNGKIPVVMALDNHWTGSLKQRVASLVYSTFLKKRFSHIWVPGIYQFEYARKLGFEKEQIITGVYTANVPFFLEKYKAFAEVKRKRFPKRFLYVGRYIDFKGVVEMWEVFQELFDKKDNEWELWCAGTGPLESVFPKHPKIKNLGFVQPENLDRLVENCGVFILPSHFEPWGVVIHEFAAAGMPLISTDAVGAATAFLINGYNGYSFEADNKKALKETIVRMMKLPEEELLKMSEKSVALSQTNSPEIWATRIMELAVSFNN